MMMMMISVCVRIIYTNFTDKSNLKCLRLTSMNIFFFLSNRKNKTFIIDSNNDL